MKVKIILIVVINCIVLLVNKSEANILDSIPFISKSIEGFILKTENSDTGGLSLNDDLIIPKDVLFKVTLPQDKITIPVNATSYCQIWCLAS